MRGVKKKGKRENRTRATRSACNRLTDCANLVSWLIYAEAIGLFELQPSGIAASTLPEAQLRTSFERTICWDIWSENWRRGKEHMNSVSVYVFKGEEYSQGHVTLIFVRIVIGLTKERFECSSKYTPWQYRVGGNISNNAGLTWIEGKK